jgi:hypothetical protein
MATKKKAASTPDPPIATPVITALDQAHTWTHDGAEVLILKCVNQGGSSSNNFVWPLTVGTEVRPRTWGDDATCNSGGLFGWPWGFGLGDGKEPDWAGKWIVFGAKPADIVGNLESERKCKAKAGIVRFVGDWNAAMRFILVGQMALVAHLGSHSKENHVTGDRSAASVTGYRSAASVTGYSSAASVTGESSAASVTGDSSAASVTGDRSAASVTGESSAASVTGSEGRARAGNFGCLALAWWNEAENRGEMRCREVGCGDGSDGKLKADTWYSLNEAGEFQEAKVIL